MKAHVRSKGDADKVLNRLLKTLKGKKKVVAGFPKGKADQGNLSKAIWNEFGTSRGIPERPFMRNTLADNKDKYKAQMIADAKGLIHGKLSASTALNRLGVVVQGDIQQMITSLNAPANAPSTIKQKGSSNPLIDTGDMRGAVTFETRR